MCPSGISSSSGRYAARMQMKQLPSNSTQSVGLGRGKHHQPPSKHGLPGYEAIMKKNANRDEWVMSQHHPAASHASRVKTILDSEVLIYILSGFKLIKLIKLNHFLGDFDFNCSFFCILRTRMMQISLQCALHGATSR